MLPLAREQVVQATWQCPEPNSVPGEPLASAYHLHSRKGGTGPMSKGQIGTKMQMTEAFEVI